MTRRVVITGLGVIAPNGNGTRDFELALRKGQSGIRYQQKMEEAKFACRVAGVPQGIDALAKKYAGQPIDILINNAALMRGPDESQTFGTMDYEEFDTFFNTNVKGPLRVTEAFWPNVLASEEKMVALLTTSQGRQGIPIDGFAYYKSSKAAIDNLYLDIGRRGRKEGVRVITLIPGRVATHGEEQTRGMTPIETSISGMIEVMENQTLKQNGKSFWWNGNESRN